MKSIYQKLNLVTDLALFCKINLKQVIGLNVKHRKIKLPGENLSDLGFGNDILEVTTKHVSDKGLCEVNQLQSEGRLQKRINNCKVKGLQSHLYGQ